MYQPDRKPRRAPFRVPSEVDPRAQGTQAEREEWMRDRQQAKKDAKQAKRTLLFEETAPKISDETLRILEIERQREAQLLAEAESEVRRRRAAERID